MARLYLLLFAVQIALTVIALISCLSAEEDQIRALPRFVWALLILFFPLVGAIAWFLAGRPARKQPGTGRTGSPRRPVAPDDDPEFLGSLNAERSRQDNEMFEKWEEDLRRREDELRRKDTGDENA